MSQPVQQKSLWFRKVHSQIKAAIAFAVMLAALLIAAPSQAQTFTFLAWFSTGSGTYPNGVIQGLDGNFYGTAIGGGKWGLGTVFRVTPTGTLTTLHSFSGSDGARPDAGLILATDGKFYGTTAGDDGNGITLFSVTASGALRKVYDFCPEAECTNGFVPEAELIEAAEGNFYGAGIGAPGVVYKITANGVLTVLNNFTQLDGEPMGSLVQSVDGNFYGTTSGTMGSACLPNCGTVFKISPIGAVTLLYKFSQLMFYPGSPVVRVDLIRGVDGDFYDATSFGGANYAGTVFKMSPGGKLSTLYSFCSVSGCPDGYIPTGAMVQATDGNFYGTTDGLNNSGRSTVFGITPDGVLTVLYNFVSDSMGLGQLVQGTDGKLYGTGTSAGVFGSFFSIDLGLAPFVKTVPIYGIVGQDVKILGNNLTGSTAVSFHGYPTKFTVVSDTEIDATVPAGAITGTVHVITPATTLASYPVFHVMPQINGTSPASGPVGTLVTITGLSLAPVKKIEFNGVQATFGVVNDTSISAYVPAGAPSGPIEVFSPGGAATSTASFTVTP